jgi:transcriptional regulator with XRE-family HTH domain
MDGSEQAFNESMGGRVRAARLQAGLTQELLARKTGLTRASITNVEKGKQAPPPYRLVRIAVALGVKAAELLPSLEQLAPTHDLPGQFAEAVASLQQAAAQRRGRDGEG